MPTREQGHELRICGGIQIPAHNHRGGRWGGRMMLWMLLLLLLLSLLMLLLLLSFEPGHNSLHRGHETNGL